MLLREYTRRARIEHFCDHCCNWISPGHLYTGRVHLPYRGNFYTLKCHDTPGCPAPEDDTLRNKIHHPHLRLVPLAA